MIKINFTQDGKNIMLTVKGHAGSAEKGKDLVCAAASILALTIAQNIKEMEIKKQLKKKPVIRLDEGNTVITCKPTKNNMNKAMHMFECIQTGYALLAFNYPEFVQIAKFESSER